MNDQQPGINIDRDSAGQRARFDPGSELDEIDILGYTKRLWRYKWGIVGITIQCAIIGALSAFSATPMYSAETSLLIEPAQPSILSSDPLYRQADDWLFYDTQQEILKSRAVAEIVVKRLKLDENPIFTGKGLKREGLICFITEKWRAWMPPPPQPEPQEDQGPSLTDYAYVVSSGLSTQQGKNSQIITVTYESIDPQLAADVVNAVVGAYIEVELESRLDTARQAVSWLTESLGDLKKKLAESEDRLRFFQEKEGVVDSTSQQDIYRRKLGSLTEKLVQAQAQRIEAEIKYQQVLTADKNGSDYDSLQPVLQHYLIQRYKEEESRFSRQMAELLQRYGPKHPKIIRARSDLEEAQKRLREEVLKVVDGIRREYEIARENERNLGGLIETIKLEIREDTGKEFNLAKLEREVHTNRQLYDTILTRFKEMDMSGRASITNVRVVDTALPPEIPFRPNRLKTISLFTAFGLILGVLLAAARERFGQTFKSRENVERELRLPVLGSVPLLKQSDLETYITGRELLSKPRDFFSETIRNIRTSIILSDLHKPPKVILVASAASQEGKSSLCCALALSFSQLGHTLLLDMDLRKPGVAKLMGVSDANGITDYISGKITLKEVTKVHPDSNQLSVITCGTKAPNTLEIIASKNYHAALEEFKKQFNYIIIDSPPILLFSDAMLLSQSCDCVIMVAKTDSTTFSMAREALASLQNVNASPSGLVMSHVDMRWGDFVYDGYSAYNNHQNVSGYGNQKEAQQ